MVEEGPFSERDLFAPRMQEKFLQRWLAAKLWDTQQRRFSVHREEELDDDKMSQTVFQLDPRALEKFFDLEQLCSRVECERPAIPPSKLMRQP